MSQEEGGEYPSYQYHERQRNLQSPGRKQTEYDVCMSQNDGHTHEGDAIRVPNDLCDDRLHKCTNHGCSEACANNYL